MELAAQDPNLPRPWEVAAAWGLRSLLVATAVFHVAIGDAAFAALCVLVIAVLVALPLYARSSLGNLPIEIELAALSAAIGDMTIGRALGLYDATGWFDKALHFGTPMGIGFLAFLVVYALRTAGRLEVSTLACFVVVVLLALGIGAAWEIVEYAVDGIFARGAQGSPAMSPLDDTMWDLIADGTGGLVGGLLGARYLRSRRSKARVAAFRRLVERRRGRRDECSTSTTTEQDS